MHTISLGNEAFEGTNNAYLLSGDDETALVDTGVATAEIERQLVDGLAEHDLELADVDEVLLTHWHPDHSGLAGRIQAESGAHVRVHEADAPLVRQQPAAMQALRDRQLERFDQWAIPDRHHEDLLARMDRSVELQGAPADVDAFRDGDRLAVAGRSLTAVHAPGHAEGLCCFRFEAADGPAAFVGDALLPVYTPNVGGADVRVEQPLAKYLRTLEAIADAGYVRAWPGHREAIDDPASRASAIIDHHRERAERVVDVLREHGPADTWTVSAHLFGDLDGIHVKHGPGEAHAHLDHLRHAGVLEEREGRYHLVDPDAPVALR